jgi:phosphocarrier protein FPr
VRHLRAVEPTLPPRGDTTAEEEWLRLEMALSAVSTDLSARAARGGPDADIAAAQEAMLADPALRARAREHIEAGESAESAWWRCVQAARDVLARGEAYVAERAADVDDLGRAVLAELGVDVRPTIRPEEMGGAVVVAEDLLPSDVPALADAGAEGVALARGGLTSHATVIARGLGLPMVIRLGRSVLDVPDAVPVVLDGDRGVVQVDPPESVLAAARRRRREQVARRAKAQADSADVAVYAHGRRIRIAANVGSLAEARAAVEVGADGVGLLRTELLYVDRPELPGEEEQAAELAEILSVLGPRPVVVRTLDVGGDKLLPALRLDPWRHGPLGERGLRHGLRHPAVLRAQLRAIVRAFAGHRGEVSVMAPMVTVAAEARAFRDLVESVVRELAEHDVPHRRPSRVGVMIEVPAAALTAEEIGAEVDFVSVGSNDLTQYVMAADRTNDAVGELYQPDHPALWRLYETLVAGARRSGCEVAVCGELAADPDAATRLVDLGVGELSMAPTAIPDVKTALLQAYGSPSRR